MFGEYASIGDIRAGELIAGEFSKFVKANFAESSPDIPPVAKFVVKIGRVSVHMNSGGQVDVDIDLVVSLLKDGSGEEGYSRTFSVTCSTPWHDKSVVPPSFYDALAKVVNDFLGDWRISTAVATLVKWNNDAIGVKPPKMKELDYKPDGKVYCGRCVVLCNSYKMKMAEGWATKEIKQMFQQTLRIEPERVRIFFDKHEFDECDNSLRLEFRAFERTEKVLTFDENAGKGFVTGDIRRMGGGAREALAEELRLFVRDKLKDRMVEGKFDVEFDEFTTDEAEGLINIAFKRVKFAQ
jgi:hypothetical protein